MGENRNNVARHLLVQADARALPLAAKSVQCVVTSPPYFALRDYGIAGQIGLESSPAAYIAGMVAVMREIRRVLRNDGTLWLNIGDSYASKPNGPALGSSGLQGSIAPHAQTRLANSLRKSHGPPGGMKHKDLIGIPWMLAFALREDGWYLRQDIIWAKPNPMPESVTDRCTKAHEYLFLLTKSPRYFYDADAIREPVTSTGGASFGPQTKKVDRVDAGHGRSPTGDLVQSRALSDPAERNHPLGRNKRSVWTIPTQSYHGAHFATFPERLVEPCIKAGTSEKGCCPACGAPWKRVVDRLPNPSKGFNTGDDLTGGAPNMGGNRQTSAGLHRNGTNVAMPRFMVGWVPSCSCHAGDPVPCAVLDPFCGSGTTVAVAARLGRRGIGTDLNAAYLTLAQKRVADAMTVRPKRHRAPRLVDHAAPSLFERSPT